MKDIFKIMKNRLILVALLLSGSVFVFSQGNPGNNIIRLGLLIQDSTSLAAKYGAELAVTEANEKAGKSGARFEILTKSMEGPWGTGSKQAVDLIFGKNVWALIGSHDGRNAHLVEQAATKSRVVMLSAWAGDPTLSQAFVPWFFNCVPNDNQQAEAIFQNLNATNSRAVIIPDDTYDSGSLLKSLMFLLKKPGGKNPVVINIGKDDSWFKKLKDIISRKEADEIILLCSPSNTLRFAAFIKENRVNLPVITSHYSINESLVNSRTLDTFYHNISVPMFKWNRDNFSDFKAKYINKYGSEPGFAASFSYDATCLLIEAIRKAGSSEREEIQKAIALIDFNGVTGRIMFDEKGNRKFQTVLTKLSDIFPHRR